MSGRNAVVKTAILSSAVLGGIAWAGLKFPVRPQPLSAQRGSSQRVAVPAGLPQPVARYFGLTSDGTVPLATSPQVTGTVRMRVPGLPIPLWMNGRWTAEYDPSRGFHRVMELGFFGKVVVTGVDEYRDGVGSVTVGDKRDSGPTVDQSADLVMWAESVWMPSILFTTPGVRWQAVDEGRARLLVPYGAREHEITWHFDTTSGLLTHLTSFRHKGTDSHHRTPWRVDMLAYNTFEQIRIPSTIAITWEDDGKPWAVFSVLDLITNSVSRVSERQSPVQQPATP